MLNEKWKQWSAKESRRKERGKGPVPGQLERDGSEFFEGMQQQPLLVLVDGAGETQGKSPSNSWTRRGRCNRVRDAVAMCVGLVVVDTATIQVLG